MEQNYIIILKQSLEKKVKILAEISAENRNQRQVLQAEELDMDAFRATIDRKAELIEQVSFLDEGFEQMYQHVKAVLQEQKETYRDEIAALKKLIGQVTEQTAAIQKEELENRALAEAQFKNARKKVRQVKDSGQIAQKYYNSMAKLNYVDPQFMDKKK